MSFESQTEEEWQAARDATRDIMAEHFGEVLGHFTLDKVVSTGDHPEAVLSAWVGIPLAVRQNFTFAAGDEKVEVLCSDGFNALVEAGVDEGVLQYWVDLLDRRAGLEATFTFQASDGHYAAEKEI